ncbi:MAG: type II toxin-antitoxin system HicB family antitoxin [Proteobacteria bacterium]|nr:type II toxin-antitoxin system HicB family antitoxin [Pseudomonadota bacterium]
MRQFTYPIKLTRDRSDGGFVVTCRDFPEAITQGETSEGALLEAADCLEEAIAGRMDDGREIPLPTELRRGEALVSVPPSMALKAAVYLAVREAAVSNSEFARRLRLDEKEARRILDPHHPTKVARIEAALAVLGRHVQLALA